MNMTDKINEYSKEVCVASYEVGAQRQMKLSVLLRMCQEISEQHLEFFGLSFEKMYSDSMVFLLINNLAKIKRMPKHNEKITIKTHPLGVCGAQFYRDYKFYSEDDLIIDVLQTSIVADAETHKVLRPKAFYDYGVFKCEKISQDKRIPKLVLPENMPLVGERIIRFSDLDYNCHLNNTIYGDIITDFIPGGVKGMRFSKIHISYINESTLGEKLKIYAVKENSKLFMCGNNSKGIGFTVSADILPMDGK